MTTERHPAAITRPRSGRSDRRRGAMDRAAIGAGARSTGSTLRPARRSAAMKSRPAPRALPSAVPGDCGRCRRPALGISTTISSSVCSNPFFRWSSRSTSLAWSNRPGHPKASAPKPGGASSQWTLRWREVDSNFRFRARLHYGRGRVSRFTWAV
jgi:hypothetical protein